MEKRPAVGVVDGKLTRFRGQVQIQKYDFYRGMLTTPIVS
jgi:hypothetical protein